MWSSDSEGSAGPETVADVSRRSSSRRWRLPLAGAAGAEIARVLGGGVVPGGSSKAPSSVPHAHAIKTCLRVRADFSAGSLTLIGGDPGVGKSTLLLQLASILATVPADSSDDDAPATPVAAKQSVLYVSGEESVEQVRPLCNCGQDSTRAVHGC